MTVATASHPNAGKLECFTLFAAMQYKGKGNRAALPANCSMQAQVNKQLSSGELGVLAQVSQRIEELLTQCFENYFMLRCGRVVVGSGSDLWLPACSALCQDDCLALAKWASCFNYFFVC